MSGIYDWRGRGKERLGVAIIGTGFMGSMHARAMSQHALVFPGETRPEIRLLVDATPDLARRAATAWGVDRWTTDWAAAVEDDTIDVVDICTPPNLQLAIGTAAAAAGRHVYCEKPLGRNLAETVLLHAAVEKYHVASLVGFNYRWCPAVQHAKELLHTGSLGKPFHFNALYHSGTDHDAPWGWRHSRELAGHGALSDLGSHIVDMARLLVGEVSQARGYARTVVHERPYTGPDAAPNESRLVTNDDEFAATWTFQSGCTGVADGSRIALGFRVRFAIEVHCTEGSLRWNLNRMNELEIFRRSDARTEKGFRTVYMGPEHQLQRPFGIPSGLSIGYVESKMLEQRGFFNGVTKGTKCSPDVTDGLAVVSVLEQIAIPS